MGSLLQRQVGTYTGSGAAQTITCGFKPSLVLMFNQTDGDTLCAFIQGQTDDTAIASAAAITKVASGGVTLTSRGFSLGSDAAANESAKVYVYIAFN
jgi:hypothetical protein